MKHSPSSPRPHPIRAIIEPLEQRILLSAAATGLTAVAASNTSVNLSWTINKGFGINIDFLIERSTSPTSGFSTIHGVSGSTSTYQDTGLTAGATYFYEVIGQVYSDILQSTSPSNIASVGTTTIPAPAAPSALVATAITTTQIDLTWTNNANNQTGFVLQRATDAAFTKNLTNINTAAATISFNNTGLAPSTTYFYRIASTNAGGNSTFSATVNATTQATTSANGKLNAVSNLVVTTITPALVVLSWNINTNLGAPLLFFELQRSTNGTDWTTINTINSTTTTDQDATVANNTTYSYRVQGIFLQNNQLQPGTPSNVVLATT